MNGLLEEVWASRYWGISPSSKSALIDV